MADSGWPVFAQSCQRFAVWMLDLRVGKALGQKPAHGTAQDNDLGASLPRPLVTPRPCACDTPARLMLQHIHYFGVRMVSANLVYQIDQLPLRKFTQLGVS